MTNPTTPSSEGGDDMNWSFEIDGAPRGKTVTRYVTHKDGKSPYEDFVPEYIIAATKCGKTLRSYFLPKEKRWAGLAEGENPIAWMHWPTFPSQPHIDGENRK